MIEHQYHNPRAIGRRFVLRMDMMPDTVRKLILYAAFVDGGNSRQILDFYESMLVIGRQQRNLLTATAGRTDQKQRVDGRTVKVCTIRRVGQTWAVTMKWKPSQDFLLNILERKYRVAD